jgi:putative membrane protein
MKAYRKILLIAGLLGGFVLVSLLNTAQTGNSSEVEDDADFLRKAFLNCLWKVESGKIAAKQTETTNVKNFALLLIVHSSILDSELAQWMTKKGIGPQREFDSTQKNTLVYLSRQRGAAIDREYMSMTADDLSTDVKNFQRAARQAKDPEIKAFAEKTVKGLKEDLVMAERILRNLPPPVLK